MRSHRTTAACLLVMSSLWAAPSARAHHIRGIPHYSYQDHYPETPVYEIEQPVDGYLVTFTYYEIPGSMALDLAMYIRDTLNDAPYDGPVTFWVFGRHEDPARTHPFTAYRNPTNIYKVGWVYEEAGSYYVRIVFDDESGEHRGVFELTVGDSSAGFAYLAIALGLVIGFAVIAGVARKKRGRARGRR